MSVPPETIMLLRRITSPLSIIGSLAILYLIIFKRQTRSAYHRFMIMISIADIGFTIAFLCSVWPVPKGMVDGAAGTMGTCVARAFFIQWFGTLGPFYNAMLEIYYVAMIRYNVSATNFAKKYEKWAHAVIHVIALGLSITGLVADVYNPTIGKISGCYITSYPPKCKSNPDVECTRGDNAKPYLFFLGILPYYIALFIIYGSILMILWTVLRKERNSSKFSFSSMMNRKRQSASSLGPHSEEEQPQRSGRKSRNPSVLSSFTPLFRRSSVRTTNTITRPVVIQSLLYGIFFSLTYLSFTIFRSIVFFSDWSRSSNIFQVLAVITSIFLPLQGLFNIIIFIRPKYVQLRQRFPDRSRFWALGICFTGKTVDELMRLQRMRQQEKEEQIEGSCQQNNVHLMNSPSSLRTTTTREAEKRSQYNENEDEERKTGDESSSKGDNNENDGDEVILISTTKKEIEGNSENLTKLEQGEVEGHKQ